MSQCSPSSARLERERREEEKTYFISLVFFAPTFKVRARHGHFSLYGKISNLPYIGWLIKLGNAWYTLAYRVTKLYEPWDTCHLSSCLLPASSARSQAAGFLSSTMSLRSEQEMMSTWPTLLTISCHSCSLTAVDFTRPHAHPIIY